MTTRIARPGEVSIAGFPLQQEALNYFARMTVSPSPAYRNAVNTAVYKWKKISVWSSIIQLVIMAADTQQAALLDITAATHDASITGSPIFTANKGFSNLSASNGIFFGLNPTLLVSDAFVSVFAGIVDPVSGAGATVIDNSTDNSNSTPGNFLLQGPASGGRMWVGPACGGGTIGESNGGAPFPAIGGGKGIVTITPGSAGSSSGASGSARSNYKTALIASQPITRMIVFGALLPSVTPDDARRFFVALAALLDEIGAFQ